jgi:hypothetical protein
MEKINSTADLKTAIAQLEQKKSGEWHLLKEQLHTTQESLKLKNIIKSTFKGAMSSPDLKSSILNTAVGLTTGFVTKKLLIGKTINPLKKLLGIVVEMAVANNVVKNADGIRSLGNMIFKKKDHKEVDTEKM